MIATNQENLLTNSNQFDQHKEKKKELNRKYYIENIEKKKKYYIQNKEKIKEANRNYYIQTKKKLKELNEEENKNNDTSEFSDVKAKTNIYFKEYRNQNKEKIKEYNQKYRIINKEKIKKYSIQNKEKMNKISRNYYLQNKEKMKKLVCEYRKLHRDKLKEYYRLYSIRNKEKIKNYQLKNREKLKKLLIKKNIERNNGLYVSLNSWKSEESIRQYFDKISPLLHIDDLSDWYRISRNQIIELKGILLIFFKYNFLFINYLLSFYFSEGILFFRKFLFIFLRQSDIFILFMIQMSLYLAPFIFFNLF